MYIVKNLFGKNNDQRIISLNSHYINGNDYIVLFKPPDVSHIMCLSKQLHPGRISFNKESFKDATSIPHGYLLLDLWQETSV